MSQTAEECLKEIDEALHELMCVLPIPLNEGEEIPLLQKDNVIKEAIVGYSVFALKCSSILRKYRNGLYQ